MNRGFTLVELSIVLVIIGLLIGGILVAQSMIETSKMSKQLQQIDQYDAAVYNFVTKYNSLPGDSMYLPNPGDGDGLIEDSDLNAGNSLFTRKFDYETSNAWAHLGHSGFLPDKIIYSNDASGGLKVKINMPAGYYGKNAGVVMYKDISPNFKYWLADYTTTVNADFNLGASPTSQQASFTSIQVQAFDKKLDDGLPNSGEVQAWDSTGGTDCYDSLITYYQSNNIIACTMFIKSMRHGRP